MLREDRIRLMTAMAIYEQTEGKQDEKIDAFFKGDYLSAQVLKSFLCATFSFMILGGVYLIYHFEELMLTIYGMDLKALFMTIIKYYVGFTVVFLIITLIIYNRRYERTRSNLRKYYRGLKELSEDYRRDGEQ